MSAPQINCPDCKSELHPIRLVDATDRAWGEGTYRVELTYAAYEAPNRWFGGIPPSGRVEGRMCPNCGRILLYGRPM